MECCPVDFALIFVPCSTGLGTAAQGAEHCVAVRISPSPICLKERSRRVRRSSCSARRDSPGFFQPLFVPRSAICLDIPTVLLYRVFRVSHSSTCSRIRSSTWNGTRAVRRIWSSALLLSELQKAPRLLEVSRRNYKRPRRLLEVSRCGTSNRIRTWVSKDVPYVRSHLLARVEGHCTDFWPSI